MKNYSLKSRLVLSIACTFVAVWIVAFAWLYLNLEKKMNETLDERLSASAHTVARLLSQFPAQQLIQTAKPLVDELNQQNLIACEVSFFSSDVVINQKVVARTNGAPIGLVNREVGFSTWKEHGVEWRSYVFKKGQLQVVSAEKVQLRDSLLTEILKSILYPLLLTLILCITLILWIIKVEFRPIEKITGLLIHDKNQPNNILENLSEFDLDTIPKEIQPFIENILELVSRLYESLENEKSFSAYAAHELRSPLTAIKTNVQLSKMIAEQSEHSDLVDILFDAEQSISRYQNLLEQLLILSQSEQQQRISAEIIDLKVLLNDVIDQLKSIEPDIERRLDIDWNSFTAIRMSYYALAMVLTNIIENSLKHAQTDLKIAIYMQNNQLFIQDFGVGLSPTELELAGKRFWRKTALENGHGLGLALCQILLQQYGYQFNLESKNGHGLTVIIDFNRKA
ncbi:sensor histidine kinase [Acinetobacter silvestris]|uniref:histidine kinase n=1 Tax=Acinetobacter silvestris TaxID=1977882 RepID=A0A1Y3CMC4_9GAMM|nr:HAMP domain-containing sensor histidine kinase [Acinetobacter silvestris]OTG67648.1 two-component sensor histidine kinase [Acinetobacter silvestris]